MKFFLGHPVCVSIGSRGIPAKRDIPPRRDIPAKRDQVSRPLMAKEASVALM